MGCGASTGNATSATGGGRMPDKLEPLLKLPYSLQSSNEDVQFTIGPKIETMTPETTTTQINIGELSLYADYSSRGIVVRTDNLADAIAICKKVGVNYNIYKLQPLWDGQKPDPYAKHVDDGSSSLYKYGTFFSNTQSFAYVTNTPKNPNSTSYRVTERKALNGDDVETTYECHLRKTASDGAKCSAAKWVCSDNNNHVKIFASNAGGDSIDVGLIVSLIMTSDYKYIIDQKGEIYKNEVEKNRMNIGDGRWGMAFA